MNNIEHQVGDYLIMGNVFDPQAKTLYTVIDITKDSKIAVQECTKNGEGAVYILKWNKDMNKWIWRRNIYDEEPLIAEFLDS